MRRQSSVCFVDRGRKLRLTTLLAALVALSAIMVDAEAFQARQGPERTKGGGGGGYNPPGWVSPTERNHGNDTIFLAYDRMDQTRLLEKLLAAEELRLANQRERFLKSIDGRLNELRAHFEKANALRLVMDEKGLSTADRRRAQGDFQESLGKVEDVARDLHERLVPVIPGMESEKGLQIQKDSDEMDLMDQQIEIAVNQFRRQPGQIMQWPGEETILVCLHWVEEMARTVRDSN